MTMKTACFETKVICGQAISVLYSIGRNLGRVTQQRPEGTARAIAEEKDNAYGT